MQTECPAIHQLMKLLQKHVEQKQLMDSFLLYLENRATGKDCERMAKYFIAHTEYFPSSDCVYTYISLLQYEQKLVEERLILIVEGLTGQGLMQLLSNK